MVFGTAHTLSNISEDTVKLKVNDTDIELMETCKYLGVYLDSKLNFRRHIEYLTHRAMDRLCMLGKMRMFVTHETSLKMYKSLLVPILDYGDMLYDWLGVSNSSKLQKVQNSALRIVLLAEKWSHIEDMHQTLNLTYVQMPSHNSRWRSRSTRIPRAACGVDPLSGDWLEI